MKVKAAKRRNVRFAAVKKKKQTLKLITVSGYQGSMSYTAVSDQKNSRYLSVNKKTGVVTVKKKAKKGTHQLKVKVKASGTASYKAGTKTVIVKVRVK